MRRTPRYEIRLAAFYADNLMNSVAHCVGFYLRDIVEEKCRLRPACRKLPGLNRGKTRITPRLSETSGAQQRKNKNYAPLVGINYYPCQGQSALSMPNFNEASLSDTLQLVYSYKILWETSSLIPFYIGHYYNNQSSHQWLLLLRKKLPISLI